MGRGKRQEKRLGSAPCVARSLPAPPLHLGTYSPALEKDVLKAINQVAAIDPLPLVAKVPQKEQKEPLPAGLPKLIAIYGKKRAGKTSLADTVEERYSGVSQIAFSSLIIEEVNDYLATLPGKTHVIDDENKADPRYRYLLQMWGQARRFEDPRYWLDQLDDLYRQALAQGNTKLVLMPGLREPAEKAEVERLGGEVWKITKPDIGLQDATSLHPNETALDNVPNAAFARIVVNDAPDATGWSAIVDKTIHEYN